MAAVLNEQRRDRIPPAGLRILQAIETECVKVEGTAEDFLQQNILRKVFNASSTVVRCSPQHAARCGHSTVHQCLAVDRSSLTL